jgi:sigma-B regulation protein RsbU (phosphoserine phosphatase)
MKTANFQLALLGVLFVWALTSQVSLSAWVTYAGARGNHVQTPFVQRHYGTTIAEVFPEYQQTGLKVGDEVTALDGKQLDGDELESQLFQSSKPDDWVSITVRRTVSGQAEQRTFSFKLKPHHKDAGGWVLTIMLSVVLPICCLLVGFYIAFARPGDPLAWITLAMLASFSQLTDGATPMLVAFPLRELIFFYQPILSDTWPLWMILFALYFPVPFPWLKSRPWVGWVLAVPSTLFSILDIYGSFERVHHIRSLGWLAAFVKATATPLTLWFTLYVFAFFVLLAVKARQIRRPDAKRRIRLMMAGCSAALTPTLPVVFGQLHMVPRMPLWLVTVCLSMLVLFPITMAYVIVVERAMDVRMVIRSGVQYAFARSGIRVLQIAIVIIVVSQTIRFAEQSNHRVAEILIGAIGAALVISISKLGQRVRGWTDKRFFREAYNSEVILTELSMSVAGIRDVKLLMETVAKRISEALHVPRIAVFLDKNGAFQPAYALGSVAPLEALQLRRDTGVVSFLMRQQAPSKVFFGDPQNWINGAPAQEQEMLRKLDTQVLLPLALKSRLLGVISLGAKRSEEPYSRGDLKLLSAVASQTGLALENAELTESVKREVAQRVRLDRELEIAREVQQRLFPQKLPEVKGLDFAGYCRPAEGVGGDYYDFIHLPDRSLGIAVGDVSGKGIAAALMMASLQASLRGQTIKPCDTLSEMIQHINKLVYEASAENRYATFFYAQYDPITLAMRYVNAGHNPPIVWRQTAGEPEFIRLEAGGTVVGLFPDFPFCEGIVQLARGDVLIAFTDGISEAMNDLDEEFGEERLTESLSVLTARSAADMITHILTKVDGFTAGAKQNDDMTLVVVRVQ